MTYPVDTRFGPPMGWICPKCSRVYSPGIHTCWYCGPGMVNVGGTCPHSNTIETTVGTVCRDCGQQIPRALSSGS